MWQKKTSAEREEPKKLRWRGKPKEVEKRPSEVECLIKEKKKKVVEKKKEKRIAETQ